MYQSVVCFFGIKLLQVMLISVKAKPDLDFRNKGLPLFRISLNYFRITVFPNFLIPVSVI
ncbi:MAG: hypothetical protein C0397_13625 [Odoribacter sp.]|nr:hypothetical protein [Odoribacter sp.]